MSNKDKNRVCPVERAKGLDNKIRILLQNPRKILKPYIKEGMTVLDFGCGPGFFLPDMAQMVGKSGRVIASDLQEGMLEIVRKKINGTNFENRIILHKCEENKIGINEKVDFILLFYMVHEIPEKSRFFKEIKTILNPDGLVLIVEPAFHVSKKAFKETLKTANEAGLINSEDLKSFLSRTSVLKHI